MNIENKRIVRNSFYMYVRLLTTLVIGLYISRLALELLDVSDYGLFAVVGGVLAIFMFISGALAGATSRFFNIEMGKEHGDVNACFNVNLTLHIVLAFIVFLLAETIGLWYIYYHLNVAAGRLDDAIFVYQVSIATACIGIINTPYQSLLTSHEQFGYLAEFDIANSVIRLCAILALMHASSGNALRLYSLIVALTTLTNFVAYHVMAYVKWREIIRFRFIRQWNRYKEVLAFNNWNLLATMAYMANNSGADLLFNAFFGTAMNGAFAVSKTVKQGIMNFTGNFDSASAPQIIQAYAAGDKERYTYLCNKIGRVNILFFELVSFPLLMELDFVLQAWLGKVPDGVYMLTFLSIIQGGISLTCGGIYNLINATGRIKWFKINVSFFFLICLPAGYVLFRMGAEPYMLLVLFIVADVVQRTIQLILMHRILGFDAGQYAREAYTRPALIAAIMALCMCCRSLLSINTTAEHLLVIVVAFLLSTTFVCTIGLTGKERTKMKEKIGQYLKK